MNCARCDKRLSTINKNKDQLCAECQHDLNYANPTLSKRLAWKEAGRPRIHRPEKPARKPRKAPTKPAQGRKRLDPTRLSSRDLVALARACQDELDKRWEMARELIEAEEGT